MKLNLVNFSEIDENAITSYCAVHDTDKNLNLGDISKIDLDSLPNDIDLITFGSCCFRAGELVNTAYGMKPIEEIKVGDIVKTYRGDYEKVSKLFTSVSNELIDIKASCVHRINTTKNHPFYVLRDGNHVWLKAEELKTTDYLCVPVNTKSNKPKWEGVECTRGNSTYIKNDLPIEDERLWYLAGRYIGDGWTRYRKERNGNIGSVIICCGKHKLNDFKDKLDGFLNYNLREDRTVFKLQFCNKQLAEFCKQFGEGAINKHIPQEILDLDVKYLKPLYEGIMDSDGFYDSRQNQYKLSSISKQLVYNMGELVLKVFKTPYHIYKTVRPKTAIIEGRTVNQHDTYNITWPASGNYDIKINYIENGYLYSRVRKIECLEDEMDVVYNFEVEGSHTYCVNNIVVHNCQDYSIAGKQAGGDEGSGTRSSLMWNAVSIIEHTMPKFTLFENVKNILSEKHRHNFDKYLDKMEELGYVSFYKVCNAMQYSIPQARERLFCVSIRKDVYEKNPNFVFPEPMDVRRSMEPFLDMNAERKCKSTLKKYFSPEYIKKYPLSKNGLLKVFDGVAQGYFKSSFTQNRIYSIKGVCPTLTCGAEVNLYELGGKLTTREAWRLMGFRDEQYDKAKATGISDGALMKQAGNSIVAAIPYYIFMELRETYPEDFRDGLNMVSLFSGIGAPETAIELM